MNERKWTIEFLEDRKLSLTDSVALRKQRAERLESDLKVERKLLKQDKEALVDVDRTLEMLKAGEE